MSWETRRNGRRYYYRKRRVGGKVVSEYFGAGLAGKLAEQFDRFDRINRDYRKSDPDIDKLIGLLDALTKAVNSCTVDELTKNGFHNHNGVWRRKR